MHPVKQDQRGRQASATELPDGRRDASSALHGLRLESGPKLVSQVLNEGGWPAAAIWFFLTNLQDIPQVNARVFGERSVC